MTKAYSATSCGLHVLFGALIIAGSMDHQPSRLSDVEPTLRLTIKSRISLVSYLTAPEISRILVRCRLRAIYASYPVLPQAYRQLHGRRQASSGSFETACFHCAPLR